MPAPATGVAVRLRVPVLVASAIALLGGLYAALLLLGAAVPARPHRSRTCMAR
jgi:hypothetical protein